MKIYNFNINKNEVHEMMKENDAYTTFKLLHSEDKEEISDSDFDYRMRNAFRSKTHLDLVIKKYV